MISHLQSDCKFHIQNCKCKSLTKSCEAFACLPARAEKYKILYSVFCIVNLIFDSICPSCNITISSSTNNYKSEIGHHFSNFIHRTQNCKCKSLTKSREAFACLPARAEKYKILYSVFCIVNLIFDSICPSCNITISSSTNNYKSEIAHHFSNFIHRTQNCKCKSLTKSREAFACLPARKNTPEILRNNSSKDFP